LAPNRHWPPAKATKPVTGWIDADLHARRLRAADQREAQVPTVNVPAPAMKPAARNRHFPLICHHLPPCSVGATLR
jgi:hypothetical protein